MANESIKKVNNKEEKKPTNRKRKTTTTKSVTTKKDSSLKKSNSIPKEVNSTKKSNKSATSKRKVASSKTTKAVTSPISSTKKEASSKPRKTSTKSTTSRKKVASSKITKAVTSPISSTKKEASSKPRKTSTKSTTSRKKVASSNNKISKSNTTAKPMLSEYYDLPYSYNETIVKILAQTPTTLFVYWDISENDRKILTQKHGENVFYDTKPILIVHNTTKNYSFEIEINDFANSWYIRTGEPDCHYVIELGRKPINNPNEYIYINSSNDITSPNNHILFEKTDLGNVLFRNVKTNVLSSKDFGSLRFINNMDKLYGNLYDVYDKLYKYKTLNELVMPSSGEFINNLERGISND